MDTRFLRPSETGHAETTHQFERPREAPPLNAKRIPGSNWILERIQRLFDRGLRRPGYAADRWAERWLHDRLTEFGLRDVAGEPVLLPRWDDHETRLTVWPEKRPGEAEEIPCFALPHCRPTEKLEARLVDLADEPARVEGNIAVDELRLSRMPQAFMKDQATRSFDPDGALDDHTQVLPFGEDLMFVMEPALEAGAAGFIGALTGVPWDTHEYYVPYDAVQRDIPGVWISGRDGERLAEMMRSGPVRAEMTVDATRTEIESYNITGTLPGDSDEWVIVGTHHDGPWASAVEDASGVALLLAQARYWSRVPEKKRPHNLLFTFNAGHMAGGAGCRAFLEAHEALLEDAVAEIHLEHAARECRAEDGELIPTDEPEVRWWFTSRNDDLEDLVEEAIRRENLRRSLILPPEFFGSMPTTDGGPFHLEDVPLVNHLAAPMYLFDPQDTPDKIHRESLVPLTRASIRIIEGLADHTAEGLRAGTRSGEGPTLDRVPGEGEARDFDFPEG